MASVSQDGDNFLMLEGIYLRLGQAKDSSALSTFGEKYLPILLGELSACLAAQPPDVSSRDKILEMLACLKRRLRSNPEAMLPIEYLLNEYKNESSSLAKNFAFVFLKIGISRLPMSEQVKLAPMLLQACVRKSYEHQLGIYFQLVPVIWRHYGTRKLRHLNEEKSQALFDLTSNSFPSDFTSKFLDFCAQLILLPENFSSHEHDGFDDEQQQQQQQWCPRGVSPVVHTTLLEEIKTASMAYLLENNSTQGSHGLTPLIQTKIGVILMLSFCGLPSEEMAWIWGIATADSHHRVAHEAEMQLKQYPGPGLNHAGSMRKLFEYYLGTTETQSVPENQRRHAVGLRVKLKLVTYFIRYADTAAPILPRSIQVLFANWFGTETNDKLVYTGTEFALHVVEKLKGPTAAGFAPVIFANVKKLMDSTRDPKLGCLCYKVMGSLGRAHPKFVLAGNKRIEMIQELFDDLSQIENDDICKAAETCLYDWLDGITRDSGGGPSAAKDTHLEACILAYAQHSSAKCRLTALRFIEKLFSFNHAPSRFALFLAISDSNDKVRQEAQMILKRTDCGPTGEEENDEGTFVEACEYFGEKVTRELERQAQTDSSGRLSAGTMKQILRYLRQRLVAHIETLNEKWKMDHDKPELPPGDDTEREETVELMEYLSTPDTYKEWKPYFELLVLYLQKFGAKDDEIIGYVSEIIYLCPETLLRQDIVRVLEGLTGIFLETVQSSSNENLITKTAGIVAVIYALTKPSDFIEREFQLAAQHLKKDNFLLPGKLYIGALLWEHLDISQEIYRRQLLSFGPVLCDRLYQAVKQCEAANLDIVLRCLRPLAAKGALGLMLPAEENRRAVYSAVLEVIKSRKDAFTSGIKESCLDFIGCWMSGQPTMEQWENVVEEIVKPAEGPPNVGLQPSIGRVLATYCVCPLGCSLYGDTRSRYTDSSMWRIRRRLGDRMAVADENSKEAERRIDWILKKLLIGEEAERSWANKNHRQAVAVWLGVMLRVFGHWNSAQDYLEQLQTFFISCLAEKDDYTQDVARRCLFLMFRCSQDDDRRLALAKSMREQLTATTAKESLLAYQEMCTLCSATCACPELTYDMMMLALNRPSIKKTHKSTSLSLSMEAVAKIQSFEHLLVPPVFRFTYDPIPQVKRVFQNIWASMTGCGGHTENEDSEKSDAGSTLMDKYASAIFGQLLYDLESGQWRYREASCMAWNDLLSGTHVSAFDVTNIGELWQRCLRVLDDMKESVRLAAMKTSNALNKFTVRLCATNGSPTAVLPVVVPILVEYGLQHNSSLVKLVSLTTLMTLIKEAPATFVKPYLPALMASFLEALTWSENEKVNYLAMRASTEERDQIDQARIAASKSSPIMDSLELCCRQVDQAVLQSLVPKLTHILQSNVGIATKTGACRLITLLRVQAPLDLTPFADALLKCLTRCLHDRNTAFRKQCASTIGQLAPLCTDSAVKQLFVNIQRWYVDSENASMEISCAYTLRAVASYSPDVLKQWGAYAAPVAFMASQEEQSADEQSAHTESNIKQIWDEVLAELTLSSFLFDIYHFCARLLSESTIWRVKALSAKSIGCLIPKIDSNLSMEQIKEIVSLLTKSLEGRTWDGKESVLVTLGMVATKFGRVMKTEMKENEKTELTEVILKECQKVKAKYRVHAITQTGIVVDALTLQLWDKLWTILQNCLNQESEIDAEDREGLVACRYTSYVALSRCLSTSDIQNLNDSVKRYGQLLIERLPVTIWREQTAILEAVSIVFDKKLAPTVFDQFDLIDSLITVLDQTRQMSIKQRCLTTLRSSYEILTNDASWKTSSKADAILNRVLASDGVNEHARELVERIRQLREAR